MNTFQPETREKLVRAYDMFGFDFQGAHYGVTIRYAGGSGEAYFYKYVGPIHWLRYFFESFFARDPNWVYLGKKFSIYPLDHDHVLFANGGHFIQAEALLQFATKTLQEHFDAVKEIQAEAERVRSAEIVTQM